MADGPLQDTGIEPAISAEPVSDIEEWVSLSLITGLGAVGFRRLLQAFDNPENILQSSVANLARIVGEPVARSIAAGPQKELLSRSMKWIARPGHWVVTLADEDYPSLLLNISDPPPILYGIGNRGLLNVPALAVVGSRNATPGGISTAQAFAQALSDAGLSIVSGLAQGIDAAGHRGGLAGASGSVAVVGNGLDIVYPAANRNLAQELAEKGAMVSEFPIGTPPLKNNFPRRNRLISGLSRGCLVVEATLRSGSLITARFSAEQGREVFALPGSIHSPLSKGCHALIKQGAKLVETAQDVLEELGWASRSSTPSDRDQTAVDSSYDKEFHSVLQAMGYDSVAVDTVCARTGLPPETVCTTLLQLELKGCIVCLPGGLYQRIR